MENCVPLPLDSKKVNELTEISKDWALCHGIIMRTKQSKHSSEVVNYAPHWLLPSPFPQKSFNFVKRIQKHFNELIHKIAHDHEFLVKSLENTIKVDEFTSKLFDIYNVIRLEGIVQPLSLGIFRSDYLLHNYKNVDFEAEDSNIKLVEINTISASFAGLGSKMPLLHRHILSELCYDVCEKVPVSNASQDIAKSLIYTWKCYGNNKAVILFVVEELVQNIFDQRILEFDIYALENQAKVIRRTFKEIYDSAHLNERKSLFIDCDEVAVVYFRTGYAPSDFTSDNDWTIRLLIERSRAIKCPSINYQLAGTKKVQQELARPGVLEKMIKDIEIVADIRKTFVGIYTLDQNEDGNTAFRMAVNNPEQFVLKPQREGGGNNIYGDDIRCTLTKLENSPERTAYILMERIMPPLVQNYFLKVDSTVTLSDVVCELGIFGVILGSLDEIMENKESGYLLRTKMVQSDEGGVAAGYGGLDSVFLI